MSLQVDRVSLRRKTRSVFVLASLVLLALPLWLLPRSLHAQDFQSSHAVGLTLADFIARDEVEQNAGRQLVDIEILFDGAMRLYSGVWGELRDGAVHVARQVGPSGELDFLVELDEWQAFVDDMEGRQGRWLDIEVGRFDGGKRRAGLFYEDGSDYSNRIETTNTDSEFQARLAEYQASGHQIVDFEAYPDLPLSTSYAGLWVDDEAQPRTQLYYGLRREELDDLLDPLHGRILDFERYSSASHGGEIRYAIIVTLGTGGWGLKSNDLTEGDLQAWDASLSTAVRQMIDLESWTSSGGLRHGALWGSAYRSLRQLTPIDPEPRLMTTPASVNSIVNDLPTPAGFSRTADIGIHARNLRTGQTLSVRGDELFYLASAAKIAIHFRLWQLAEPGSGQIQMSDEIQFTYDADSPDPYFVDNRGAAFNRVLPGSPFITWGLNSCGCNGSGVQACRSGGRFLLRSDLGQGVDLQRLDNVMMLLSDNAATSMLMDDPALGLTYNSDRDGLDINEWLSRIPGVARGFGVLTSIQNLDRLILWQGQRAQFLADPAYPSLFLAPRGSLETYVRFNPATVCDGSFWGVTQSTLLTWVQQDYESWAESGSGADGLPDFDFNAGVARYYNMGLNSAEPRAMTNLIERFVNDEFTSSASTKAALDAMGEFSPLRFAGLPSHFTVSTKGGSKDGVSNPKVEVGIYRMMPADPTARSREDVVVGIYAKNNTYPSITGCPGNTINRSCAGQGWTNVFTQLAQALVPALTANLVDVGDEGAGTRDFSPERVKAGDTVTISTRIKNQGGADTPAYRIEFFASTDAKIGDADDVLLHSQTFSAQLGYVNREVIVDFQLPPESSLPLGSYRIGWLIDPVPAGENFGDVPEYDEPSRTNPIDPADPSAPSDHYNPIVSGKTLEVVSAGTLSLVETRVEVGEGDGAALLQVSRLGGSHGAVSVDWALSPGSATPGVDYTVTGGTFHWDDGDARDLWIGVPILEDDEDEADESLLVTLSRAVGGAALGNSTLTLVIEDNDEPRPVVADLAVQVSNGTFHVPSTRRPADYTVIATNLGPEAVTGANVELQAADQLSCGPWTCTPSPGASCSASGSGLPSDVVDLEVGSFVKFVAPCLSRTRLIEATAVVVAPPHVVDPDPANNSSVDTDSGGLIDGGDAPPPYATGFAEDGARHGVTFQPQYFGGPRLGRETDADDAESDEQAEADDRDDFDDEDGVFFWSPMTPGAAAQVEVYSGSEIGVLDAWIDFNADGDWDDAGERVLAGVELEPGPQSLGYAVPADAAVGDTFARFRVSTEGTSSPRGFASDGEVEDHRVAIRLDPPVSNLSLSKADGLFHSDTRTPYEYRITVSNQGPDPVLGAWVRDNLSPPLEIWPKHCGDWACTASGGATCSAEGTGDINDQVDLPVGGELTYVVSCAEVVQASAYLLSNTATVEPPLGVSDPAPADNRDTDTTTGLLVDVGNAPAPYSRPPEEDGARHVGAGGLIPTSRVLLGQRWRVDDGVVPPESPVDPGDSANFELVITEVSQSPSPVLDAWADWNADGDWDDDGERVLDGAGLGAGTYQIAMVVPGDAVLGTTWVRFRVSTTGTSRPDGPAIDGEVEDYPLVIGTPPKVIVRDAWTAEGDEGLTEVTVKVQVTGLVTSPVTVELATANGSATTEDGDYTALSTSVTFLPSGPSTQAVSLQVSGDGRFEGDEDFRVVLSNPVGAAIERGIATVDILDDDTPLRISDVALPEGDAGVTTFPLVVELAAPSSLPVTMDVRTGGGSAEEGSDYIFFSARLTLAPGETQSVLPVVVLGDVAPEGDEYFFALLTRVHNAVLVDNLGRATILDDDPDADTDGVADEIEAMGPNGGDGNGDGVPDAAQGEVVSLPSVVTGDFVTLALDPESECDIEGAESLAREVFPHDPGYQVAQGLLGFELSCDRAVIDVLLHGESAPTPSSPLVGMPYRKYGPTPADPSDHWYTLSHVSGLRRVGGLYVPFARLDLRDGGIGDHGPAGDGRIVDPGGVAVGDQDPELAVLTTCALARSALVVGPAATVGCSVRSEQGSIVLRNDSVVHGNVVSRARPAILGQSSRVEGDVRGNRVIALHAAEVAGSVVSDSSVLLGRGASVGTDVVAGGRVVLYREASVAGSILEHQEVPAVSALELPELEISGRGKSVSVKPGRTLELKPGAYGRVTLGKESVLILEAGEYRFESVRAAKGSRLHVENSTGPVVLSVSRQLILDSAAEVTSTGAVEDILWLHAGRTVRVGSDSRFLGTLVAPRAVVSVRDRATVAGALYGGVVHLGREIEIESRPALQLFTQLVEDR